MKLSKVENLENPVEDCESMEENENIQLDVDIGDTPIHPLKKKKKAREGVVGETVGFPAIYKIV